MVVLQAVPLEAELRRLSLVPEDLRFPLSLVPGLSGFRTFRRSGSILDSHADTGDNAFGGTPG
jgi:hypothetical protein